MDLKALGFYISTTAGAHACMPQMMAPNDINLAMPGAGRMHVAGLYNWLPDHVLIQPNCRLQRIESGYYAVILGYSISAPWPDLYVHDGQLAYSVTIAPYTRMHPLATCPLCGAELVAPPLAEDQAPQYIVLNPSVNQVITTGISINPEVTNQGGQA